MKDQTIFLEIAKENEKETIQTIKSQMQTAPKPTFQLCPSNAAHAQWLMSLSSLTNPNQTGV